MRHPVGFVLLEKRGRLAHFEQPSPPTHRPKKWAFSPAHFYSRIAIPAPPANPVDGPFRAFSSFCGKTFFPPRAPAPVTGRDLGAHPPTPFTGFVVDISVYKTFTLVAKYGSISIASEEVHLTQPAVTKQIKYLEELYGMRLFERNNRLKLTPEGSLLLAYANQILDTYNESLAALMESRDQVKGILKFGSNLTLGIYVIPRLIQKFSSIYPDIQFEIFLHNTEQIVKAIRQKEINFGFISADTKGLKITRHLFFKDRIVAVVGKPLRILTGKIEWEQLHELPFITRERGSDIRETVEQGLKERKIQLHPKLELNNTEAIKECVRCGFGFSFLPKCTVEHEVKMGLLDEIRVPYFDPVQEFHICHFEGRKLSKPESIFLDFALNTMESRVEPLPRVSLLPPTPRKTQAL